MTFVTLKEVNVHLREHKFKYSFQDNLKSICNCGKDTEASSHYLLRSQEYLKQRKALLNAVKHIYPNILD